MKRQNKNGPLRFHRMSSEATELGFSSWATVCMDQNELGREVGLGLRDIVLDGDSAFPHLKGHSPRFSVNVRCGQTA